MPIIYPRDGSCDGGDHPSDHDVGAPPNPESDSAMPLFPREMFTGLNTGICTKGYASFRDNAKVLEPSLCCSVPSQPASSPGGLATKAETLPPARCGCTRSSMTAFVSSPRR